MKKPAVDHVLRSSLEKRLWLLILASIAIIVMLRPEFELLANPKSRCEVINMAGSQSQEEPQESRSALEPKLESFLLEVKDHFRALEAKPLLKKLNPRLRHSLLDVDKIIQRMKFVLGEPFEISFYRVWKLDNPSEQMKEAIPCGSEQNFSLFPHYGIKQHHFIWLQILGSKEIGRVLLSIVQEKGEFSIGYLNFHKWTHLEKDFEIWLKEGNEDINKNHTLAAYVKYDIARKLLSGNPHLEFKLASKLELAITENFPEGAWISGLRKVFEGEELLSAASLFSLRGIGLSLHFRLPKEISGLEVRKHCEKQLNHLTKQAWFTTLEGIKCSYFLKDERLDRPGRLGSLYLAKEK